MEDIAYIVQLVRLTGRDLGLPGPAGTRDRRNLMLQVSLRGHLRRGSEPFTLASDGSA